MSSSNSGRTSYAQPIGASSSGSGEVAGRYRASPFVGGRRLGSRLDALKVSTSSV